MIEDILKVWEESIPKEIQGGGVTENERIRFFLMCFNESLATRSIDLLRAADLNHSDNNHLIARMATRSALETVSVSRELIRQVQSESDLDWERIKGIALGSRIEGVLYKQTNALTLVQKLDKEYPGVLKDYEWLCETAHPNFMGVLAMYCRVDQDNTRAEIGLTPEFPTSRHGEVIKRLAKFSMKFYLEAFSVIKEYEI